MRPRFLPEAPHAALDAERERRGLSWRAVAREIEGIDSSIFSRLARGRSPSLDNFAAIAAWTGAPVETFFVGLEKKPGDVGEARAVLRRAIFLSGFPPETVGALLEVLNAVVKVLVQDEER